MAQQIVVIGGGAAGIGAAGDGKLGEAMLRDNFAALYDPKS